MAATLGAACVAIDKAGAQARAEDWLAAFASCEESPHEARGARLELLYPRKGLPAVAAPGALLVVRLELPAALTPPPGIQQARALVGFRAELELYAMALPPRAAKSAAAQTHAARVEVPIVSVRPDGPTSLVYRASIELPEGLPQGSYALRVHTPFGALHAERSVRIVAPGAAPRLAWLARSSALDTLAAAALPFEVMVETEEAALAAARPVDRALAPPSADRAPAEAAPSTDRALAAPRQAAHEDHPAAPVRLDPSQLALALRLGDGELLVIGKCAARIEPLVKSVLERERRKRIELARAPRLPAQSYQPLTATTLHALPTFDALELAFASDTLELRSHAREPLELSLLSPSIAHGYALEPASALRALSVLEPFEAGSARVVLRVQLAPSTRLSVARKPNPIASSQRPIARTRPERIVSGQPFEVRIDGVPSSSLVALSLVSLDDGDRARLGFGPGAHRTVLHRPGEHRLRALVIAADGSGKRVESTLTVAPDRRVGCTVPGARGAVRASEARGFFRAALGVLLAAWVLKRRRPARPGNRLAREPRCE